MALLAVETGPLGTKHLKLNTSYSSRVEWGVLLVTRRSDRLPRCAAALHEHGVMCTDSAVWRVLQQHVICVVAMRHGSRKSVRSG